MAGDLYCSVDDSVHGDPRPVPPQSSPWPSPGSRDTQCRHAGLEGPTDKSFQWRNILLCRYVTNRFVSPYDIYF